MVEIDILSLYPGYDKVYGPYVRKDGRKHIVLYSSTTFKRKTISYSKILLEMKLGRKLLKDETVDHVDENFTNDSPGNLQPLPRGENAAKGIYARYGERTVKIDCAVCGFAVVRYKREVKRSAHTFCSNKCRALFYR